MATQFELQETRKWNEQVLQEALTMLQGQVSPQTLMWDHLSSPEPIREPRVLSTHLLLVSEGEQPK